MGWEKTAKILTADLPTVCSNALSRASAPIRTLGNSLRWPPWSSHPRESLQKKSYSSHSIGLRGHPRASHVRPVASRPHRAHPSCAWPLTPPPSAPPHAHSASALPFVAAIHHHAPNSNSPVANSPSRAMACTTTIMLPPPEEGHRRPGHRLSRLAKDTMAGGTRMSNACLVF
jgi:hypothetical protein